MERLAFTSRVPGRAVGRVDGDRAPLLEVVRPAVPERDETAFKWLLAFTFVLFVRPQDTFPFLQLLHLADITASCALIALIIGRLNRGAAITRMTRELIGVLALGAVMLGTAPFAVWQGGAVAVFTDLYSKVILVFALIVNTVTTRQRFERLTTVVVLGTSYIATRGVLDYLRGVNLHEDGRLGGAVGGLFGNPNDMALNMVAFLPLAIVVALGRHSAIIRAAAALGVPAIAAAIIFTKSRGGAVGLGAMMLVLLYQLRRVRPGVAALVVAASLSAIPFLPESFTQRMSSIIHPEEDPLGSREARKRLLREGYQAFLDNPIVGLGAGQFMNYEPEKREEPWRETHNAVLQVAAELGAGGLIVFMYLIGAGFAAVLRAGRVLRRNRPRRRAREPAASRRHREPLELYAAAMVASLTGWFAAAMFASVAYYWTFYLVLGLAAALRDITVQEVQPPADVRRAPAGVRAA